MDFNDVCGIDEHALIKEVPPTEVVSRIATGVIFVLCDETGTYATHVWITETDNNILKMYNLTYGKMYTLYWGDDVGNYDGSPFVISDNGVSRYVTPASVDLVYLRELKRN